MDELGKALTADGPDRQKELEAAANSLREELEQLALIVTGLVLEQPPTGLLGYIWGQVFIGTMQQHAKKKRSGPPTSAHNFDFYQLVLEYLHAVWSATDGPFPEGRVDEPKAKELLAAFEEFRTKTMHYCMASSMANRSTSASKYASDMEFQAKSTWVLLRGHRHQVLEEEFFSFTLAPHEAVLREAYGMGSAEIAKAMQQIADAFRAGHAKAGEILFMKQQETVELAKKHSLSMKEAIEKVKSENPDFAEEMTGAWKDLFEGGICNVSRKAKLSAPLLEDMAYEPGTETKFFEKGALAGTPLRTLPARIRPLVRLNEDYYATDGQFVRDSAYRAIQRGLIGRIPTYRETWNKKQKEMTEGAFQTIFSEQLKGAMVYNEVYFKDVATDQWVETDIVALLDDNLFIIEAKAGVMAMHSPATDFDRHIRAVNDLVIKAYKQCQRFTEYLASSPDVPIFELKNGNHTEVARLRLDAFRKIIPIGLTVEAFTPFSAMCKKLPEVEPLLGKHPFVSMSVDDLFVLKRFLPTSGSLFHYLDVRQQVAGIRDAMMFDEQDHLGAYVSRNRFDRDMIEQLKEADWVTWDAFSDKISDYFQGPDWQDKPVPQQAFAPELFQILSALDQARPTGWLRCDAYLRDLSSKSRENLASLVRRLLPSLSENPARSFLFDGEMPLQVFLHQQSYSVPEDEIRHRGEVACLISKKPNVLILVLGCDENGQIVTALCSSAQTPPIIRADYEELIAEAESKRTKYIELRSKQAQTSSEKLSKRAKRRNRGKAR